MKTIFLIILSISILNATYIRDDDTGIVKETTTNLEWQDDAVSSKMGWEAAIDYCEGLSLEGSGWQLPNINQLNSIVDYARHPALKSAFTHTGLSYYWSSTTNVDQPSTAFLVEDSGDNAYGHKTSSYYVRCVREGQ